MGSRRAEQGCQDLAEESSACTPSPHHPLSEQFAPISHWLDCVLEHVQIVVSTSPTLCCLDSINLLLGLELRQIASITTTACSDEFDPSFNSCLLFSEEFRAACILRSYSTLAFWFTKNILEAVGVVRKLKQPRTEDLKRRILKRRHPRSFITKPRALCSIKQIADPSFA